MDNFLLTSNTMSLLEELKKCLAKKYNTKDLKEVKIIIRWQISRNIALGTIKIDQLAFIRDLVIEERFTKYNPNVIPMKASSAIDINKVRNYEETDLRTYQCLTDKLIYLACGTRSDIAFVVGQLSKYNANLKKNHLQVAKKIVRYLYGIIELGFIYSL